MSIEDNTDKRHYRNSYNPDVVKKFCESGLSKSEYARRNGIHANVLTRWIARYDEDINLGSFVRIGHLDGQALREHLLEIILPDGIRVRITDVSLIGETIKSIRGV
jgi:transposase